MGKKIVRINESDIRKMVVRVLNETLGEGDFDDIEGLEPDPEEKSAQMDQDWKDYYNPKNIELRYEHDGSPWIYRSAMDDTSSSANDNIYDNGLNGFYGLEAQGYNRNNPGGRASVRKRMFAQEYGPCTSAKINKKGDKNWPADIDTTSDYGDIDSDGNSGIVGMSGAWNGRIANRDSHWGKYSVLDSLDEVVSRAIRKYLK